MDPNPSQTTAPAPPRTPARPRHPIITYPGFDVMSQQGHWDEATRRLLLHRVNEVPPIRFFGATEVRILGPLAEHVLPQNDRPPEQRIPLVPWIDQRCFERITDGWRFDNMPPDDEAWRLGLRGIDEVARLRFSRAFVDLDPNDQDAVLHLIAGGDPPGPVWRNLPAQRFWIHIVLRQLCSVYFAHPTSWNEIGFGGPAYPRGYVALNHGYPEPWEAREVRLDAATD